MKSIDKKIPGILEKSLVRDLMRIGVMTTSPETSVQDLSKLFIERNVEVVIILEPSDGNAIGVVTQNELIKSFAKDCYINLTARDIMQEEIPQIPPEIPIKTAAQMMLDNEIRTYFLMHHSNGVIYPAASISIKEILQYLAAKYDSELAGLGFAADRENPLTQFLIRKKSRREFIEKRKE